MTLSDAIRDLRRNVVAEAEADPAWLTPRKIEICLAVFDAWAAEAQNMETRLAFYEPYQPIIDLSFLRLVGGPR